MVVLPAMKSLYCDKPYEENPPLAVSDSAVHFLPAEAPTPGQRAQLMAEVLDLFERVNPAVETCRAEINMAKVQEDPYTSWDNLLGVEVAEEEEKKKVLAAAPDSVMNGGDGFDGTIDKGLFKPSFVMYDKGQFPDVLPGLKGVAVEYKYENQGTTSIAPSMFQDSGLPDLPQIAEFAAGPTALQPHTGGIMQDDLYLRRPHRRWPIQTSLPPHPLPHRPAAIRSMKPPLTLADEIAERMRRRQNALSGKQDRMEQDRDRKQFVKPVVVLKAVDVAPPPDTPRSFQPPPPPLADYPGDNKALPTVDISDDGSNDGSDGAASNYGDEVLASCVASWTRADNVHVVERCVDADQEFEKQTKGTDDRLAENDSSFPSSSIL
ncbi:hypothetical protein DYB32_000710 [Aphanomyces invadans]|uniref:WASH1 WAHD domain-containing protein n=1 Tax=Aphanomyces invadans TaxID=157072 RepID=A0A418B945_9STRA|nr:hypothetical protein DYB32_000710 [Aphanomyces invadans]